VPGCTDRSWADPSCADLLSRPASEVAPRLLGCLFSHTTDGGTVTVELTEVEAYMGEADPASHAYRGPTPRNQVMFGEPGHLYVYRSYGMHWCCNVVTGRDGTASAVLLRAGRVVDGVELARERRGERVKDRALARGPGCLGQALGLTREQNGADLLGSGGLRLRAGSPLPADGIASGHRVGVTLAHDVPWRFWVLDDPTVSAYKRSPRAVVE
jgi:DNA-3-methyladenine glycosylase